MLNHSHLQPPPSSSWCLGFKTLALGMEDLQQIKRTVVNFENDVKEEEDLRVVRYSPNELNSDG